MKMKRSILFAGMLIAFTGCVKVQLPIPLEQKLTGKTSSEQKEVLYQECKEVARHRAVREFHPYSGQYIYHQHLAAEFQLQKICNAMHKEPDLKNNKDLVKQCHTEADKAKNPESLKRMNLICNKWEHLK
jgi:hypothetical protein